MPDDAFQVVGATAAGAMFNKRGALIAYPGYGPSVTWTTLLGASAADVFGDGDIGIGRWNGGATVSASRAGIELTPVAGSGGYTMSAPYALARAATNVPTCGVRRLQLVASTLSQASQAGSDTAAAPGLTADSSVSFQYASDTLVGVDIGVRAADGTVVRYRSTGGSDAPWASNIRLSDLAKTPVSVQGPTWQNGSMGIQGLASGNGENKLVLKISPPSDLMIGTEFAAAFAAPTAGVDQSGCAAAVGEPGTAIDPAPANGKYEVLLGMEPGTTVAMVLGDQVSFRTRGELSSSVNLQVGATTPVYELAGTADASIGRIDGTYTIGVANYRNSLPYAVARAGATIPTTGHRHYVLVASTAVVPLLADATGELPAGSVQAASLDADFGADMLGQRTGTATFSLSGSVGGIPFAINPPTYPTTPDAVQFSNGSITFTDGNHNLFRGAFAAPTGEYAVVSFAVRVGGLPAGGTLLFRAQ